MGDIQGPAGDLVSLLFRPLALWAVRVPLGEAQQTGCPLRPDRSSPRGSVAGHLSGLTPHGTRSWAVASVRQPFQKGPAGHLRIHRAQLGPGVSRSQADVPTGRVPGESLRVLGAKGGKAGAGGVEWGKRVRAAFLRKPTASILHDILLLVTGMALTHPGKVRKLPVATVDPRGVGTGSAGHLHSPDPVP